MFILCGNGYGQTDLRFQPTGKLVDAGGHRLHIYTTGKGNPTVIFENGSGDFSFIWSLVQPKVSEFAKTLSYDRAGFAWSEPGPSPRSFQQITLELHTALKNANISPPYILVGQSFCGFLVRAFARYYPKEVAGMVLVDALNEDSKIMMDQKPVRLRDWAKGLPFSPPKVTKLHSGYAKKDWPITYPMIEPPMDRLPQPVQEMQKWAQSDTVFQSTVNKEMTWSPEELAIM